jgi:tetratricopeptide (TPR) repeat protein
MMKENKFEDALVKINEAAEMCTNSDPRVLTMKADILQCLGRYEEAIAVYDLVHVMLPASAPVFSSLANCVMMLGRDDEALMYLDQILSAAPDYAPALVTRAIILGRKGENEDSLRDLMAAVAAKPIDLETNLKMGQCFLSHAKIDMAIAIYKDMAVRYPNDASVNAAMGIAQYMSQDYISACDSFTRVLALGAVGVDIYVKRASCYLHFENVDKALADLNEAKRLDPNFHLTDLMLAQCHQTQKKWRDAIRAYDAFLAAEEKRIEEIVKTDSFQLASHNAQRFQILQHKATCYMEAYLDEHPATAKAARSITAAAPQLRREPTYAEVNSIFEDTYKIVQQLNIPDINEAYTALVLARKAIPAEKTPFTAQIIRLRAIMEAMMTSTASNQQKQQRVSQPPQQQPERPKMKLP